MINKQDAPKYAPTKDEISEAYKKAKEALKDEKSCLDGKYIISFLKKYDHWGIIHSDEESSKN